MATETKAAHTPAPWTFATVRTSVGICHKIGEFPTGRVGGLTTYACVYEDGLSKQVEWDRGRLDSELFANARLIASAPDLLAALHGVITAYRLPDECVHDNEPDICDACHYAMEIAMIAALNTAAAAILKAEGR